jgi:hypothetical protein
MRQELIREKVKKMASNSLKIQRKLKELNTLKK